MANSGPVIDEYYAKRSHAYLYFYFHYESPNLNYGMQREGGWVVQIKINDDQIDCEKGFDYVLSPYIWNNPGDPNDSSITHLNDSLSFRDVASNGWVSQSLGIFHPMFFPDFFCVKVPLRMLIPSAGKLDYTLWILSTAEGNPMQSEYKGKISPIIQSPGNLSIGGS